MKKIVKYFLLVVLIVAVLGGIVYFAKNAHKTPDIYETKTPVKDNVVKKTVATGKVVPRNEIEIKPHINGIIETLYVEPGDYVKKGDLIAKVVIIPDMIQLSEAESRLNKAKLNCDDAKLIYDRQKKIYDEGVIPKAEFQKYELALNNAKAELDAAENYLQITREGVTKKAGTTTNTLIRSTIEGMVLDVPVEVGKSVIAANTFNEGTTIASVADMGEMIFEGKIDETEVGKLKSGMELEIIVGAIEGTKFNAKLEYIAPKGIEENGAIQFKIKAAVQLIDSVFIRAGYSANADIVLDERDSVMVIPEALVKFENEGDSAYVEVETSKSQVFEKKYIQLGLSDGLNIEVKSGLTMEDKIKTNNKIDLKKQKEEEKKEAEKKQEENKEKTGK